MHTCISDEVIFRTNNNLIYVLVFSHVYIYKKNVWNNNSLLSCTKFHIQILGSIKLFHFNIPLNLHQYYVCVHFPLSNIVVWNVIIMVSYILQVFNDGNGRLVKILLYEKNWCKSWSTWRKPTMFWLSKSLRQSLTHPKMGSNIQSKCFQTSEHCDELYLLTFYITLPLYCYRKI